MIYKIEWVKAVRCKYEGMGCIAQQQIHGDKHDSVRVTRRTSQFYHIQISREKPVLQKTSIWDVNPLTFARNDDDGPAKRNIPSKMNVSRYRKVVQVNNIWYLLEALLKVLNLLEMIVQFDDRSPTKYSLLVDDQLSVFYGVDITPD